MLRVVLILALTTLTASAAWAVPVGVDDFEDGTTAGWHVGDPDAHPADPANVSTGGPAGAGDAYLQLQALGGNGPGSRLAVLNLSQWTDDFTSVAAIGMDVNNFGPDDLVLRLLLVDFPDAPGPPTNVAWTLAPVVVPSGSGWNNVLFSLSLANLFAPIGTAGGALADVDELRIFHNPDPFFGGPSVGAPPVVVTLGIDNIGAVVETTAVPEPASMLLMLAGLGAGARRMVRGKRQEHN
jgi:PEP-CTERM motif